MPFVIDASVTMVWVLADEANPIADHALARTRSDEALAPVLWWYEIRNALISGERNRRLTPDDSDRFLRELAGLRITLSETLDQRSVFRLCRKHKLTFYDAAYLELAQSRNLPLATLDAELARAARREKVALLGAAA